MRYPLLFSAVALSLAWSGQCLAQDATGPILGVGDAVVTGFSGVRAPASEAPDGGEVLDETLVDPDGVSARILPLAAPGFIWDGRVWSPDRLREIRARDVGQVFGVAIDDAERPNIYLAATSAYGLHVVAPDADGDGRAERLMRGRADAQWAEGMWGVVNANDTSARLGGPGSIWKVDGGTSEVTLFANVELDGAANAGPGLGNLAFDPDSRSLFASDLSTGMIHRFSLDGTEQERFDHGVDGRAKAGMEPVARDPSSRLDIVSSEFDTENPHSWGYAAPERRVHGLSVHGGRLYYAVADSTVWSVGVDPQTGQFAADARKEIDIPQQQAELPVTDLLFTRAGVMVLAERGGPASIRDYAVLADPGQARLLRYRPENPDDPATPSRWIAIPDEYAVGFEADNRSTNGGVALNYGYSAQGFIDPGACEGSLWTTGDNLRREFALENQLLPGGPLAVDGLQGMPFEPVKPANSPPWTSYMVDVEPANTDASANTDDPLAYSDIATQGWIGDVLIRRAGCDAAFAGAPGIISGGNGKTDGGNETETVDQIGCSPGKPGCLPQDSTIAVRKVCEPARYGKYAVDPVTTAAGWRSHCTITVTTTGSQSGVLTVGDQLSGGTLLSLASNSTPAWTCAPGGCSINGASLNPIASTSIFAADVVFASPGHVGEGRNCAVVASDGKPAGKDCTIFSVDEPTIAVTKTCEPAKHVWIGDMPPRPNMPANGYVSICHITVATTGVVASPINVSEMLTGAGTVSYLGSTDPWACAPPMVPGNAPMNCTLPGNVMAGPSDVSVIDVKVTFASAGAVKEASNCASAALGAQQGKKSCDDFEIGEGTASVAKVCDPAVFGKYPLGPAATGLGLHANCRITVTTTGPQTGVILVNDSLVGTGNVVNMTAPSPWSCTTPVCSVNGASLNQTASTSVINVIAVFANATDAQEARNCAAAAVAGKPLDRDCTPIVVDNDPEVTINKVCGPAVQLDSPVLQFGAHCAITVTTTGPIQTHLVVSDNLAGNGQITSFTNTSTPAWTCILGQCDMEGSNLNQTSSVSTFDAFVTFPPGQGADHATARNCAKLGFDAHPASESCADIKAEDPKGLSVRKVVINHAPQPVTGMAFTVKNTCSNDATVSGLDTLTDGQTKPFHIYMPGVTCTVQELAIPPTTACGSMTPVWTTTYLPSQTVALAPGGTLVTVQNTLDCVPVDNPTPSTQTISKVCEPATEVVGAVNSYQSLCHITVTTTGPQSGTLAVNDNLLGGGAVTSMTGPAPWVCSGAGCTANGSQLDQTSSTSVIDAVVSFPSQGHVVEARNCATLSSNGTPVEACTEFTVGEGDKFSLDVKKDCSGVVALTANGPWAGSCQITVTASGGPRPPFIAISDVISDVNASRSPPVSMTGSQSADPWACSGSSPSGPVNCTIAGSAFPASGTSTINIQVYVPIGVKSGEAKNCVTAFGATDPQTLTLSTPPVSTGEVCAPLPGGKPDQAGISITKLVEIAGPANLTGIQFPVTYDCGSGPQAIQLANGQTHVVNGLQAGANCTVTEGPVTANPCGGDGTSASTATWLAPVYQPSQTVAAGPGAVITITNTLTCSPSSVWVNILKEIRNENGVIIPLSVTSNWNVDFPVTLNCGSFSLTQTLTGSYLQTGWGTANTLPPNTACVAVETPTPPPPGLCSPGSVASWETSYIPSTAVLPGPCATVGSGPGCSPPSIKVVNKLKCEPTVRPVETGLSVKKVVVNNSPGSVAGLKFWISASCQNPAQYLPAAPIMDNQTINMTPMVAGQTCSIEEHGNNFSIANPTLVSGTDPFQTTACGNLTPVWTTTYFPSQTVTNSPTGATIVVTNTLNCEQGAESKAQQVIAPTCDPATATQAGDLCRCRFDNMAPVSKTACECKDGFTLKAGQGCVRKVVTPKCDPATTVAKGGKCACRFANMVQASSTACACAKGFKFAPGKGCTKPEPVCGKGQHIVNGRCVDKPPVCGKNQTLVKGRCVTKQPACKKPFVYDPRRNACVEVIAKCGPGQIRVKGRCVSVPKCPPGTIPVPGTRACVSIGIGIGGPRPDGPRGHGGGKPRCNRAVQECG